MKNLLKVVFLVSGALVSNQIHAMEGEGSIRTLGRIHQSFSDDYFIVQAKHQFLKINAKLIDAETKKILSSGGESQKNYAFNLPRKSIDLMWTEGETEVPLTDVQIANHLKARQVGTIMSGKGFILVKGFKSTSFEEEFAILRVNDLMFKIKKGKLPREENLKLSEAMPEDYVNLMMPTEAIEMAWSNRQNKNNVAALSRVDRVNIDKNKVHFVGKSIFSELDGVAILQVNNSVYHLDKSSLSENINALFDRPQSLVEFSVNRNDILYMYNIPGLAAVALRSPAGQFP